MEQWKYKKNNQEAIERLQNKYKINKLLATVLANRNIEETRLEQFLNPTRNDFYDPFKMPDMEIVVARIIKAIENKEKIIIYGDYDVDGITSTAVLKSFFRDRGIEVTQYIPNRLYEGYGLNKEAIKKIAKENCNLIITVDCGITAIEEIELAKNLNMDVIVTDHHEPGETIPDAIGVVDCKRKDNKYPFRELAGVGVAFKLCQALGIKLGLEEKEYLKYLDIVAIGTIADVVPLVDENRTIAKLGLKLLNVTKNYGIKALIRLAGIKKIDATSVAFGIAPRLNACGRLGFADEALDLIFANSEEKALDLGNKIIKYNIQRQEYEKKIYEEAQKYLEEKNVKDLNSIVIGKEDWHHGVVGIAASKITEKYYKPTILICFENGSDIGRGSGRSIPEFDLFGALSQCKDLFENFGGHSMAIGLSIKRENLGKLQERLEEIASTYNIKEITPTIELDADINLDEITKEMVESLNLLEPFGEANSKPIFSFKGLKVVSIRTLSEGKHLKLMLQTANNAYIDAIGFNMGELESQIKCGTKIDLAGNLEINSFNLGMDVIFKFLKLGTDVVKLNL